MSAFPSELETRNFHFPRRERKRVAVAEWGPFSFCLLTFYCLGEQYNTMSAQFTIVLGKKFRIIGGPFKKLTLNAAMKGVFFPLFVFGESHTCFLSSPLFLSLPTPMARENWPPAQTRRRRRHPVVRPFACWDGGKERKGEGARLGPSDWRPDWVGWLTGARKGGREKEDHPMFFHVGVC